MMRWLQTNLQRYLLVAKKRPKTLLLVAVAITLGAIPLVLRINVDARIQSLLPAGTASARSIDELRRRSTSDAPLYLLVASSNPALNRQLAQSLRDEVLKWPETLWAINQRDPEFFSQRRMLYLPAEELEGLADRVEQIVEWEECDAIPGCVNLDDRPTEPSEDEIEAMFRELPEVKALQAVVGDDGAIFGKSSDRGVEGSEASSQDGRRPGELCGKGGQVCAVQVTLDGDPSDLDFAGAILERSEALFQKLRPDNAPEDLRLATSGQYRNAPETKRVVVADLSKTAALSTLLVLVVLTLQFRGVRALVLLAIPVGMATVWTLAVAGAVAPTLNLISAFTLAVLAGLGIDFGVHVLTHYGSLRESGAPPEEAIEATYAHLAPSMAVAGFTTGCGFLSLVAASFRGFSEMGMLAALGIGMAWLASVMVLPPLILAVHQLFPEKSGLLRTRSLLSIGNRGLPPRKLAHGIFALGATIAALLGAVGLGLMGPGVSLEHDFSKLRPPSVGHGIAWGEAMHGTTRSASYILADRGADLIEVEDQLREEGLEASDKGPSLVTPSSFVPREQPKRLAALARLRDASQRAMDRSTAESKASLLELMPYLEINDPILPEDLPQWVKAWLVESDGRFGLLAVLYNDFRGSDARQMEQLASQLDSYRERFPRVRFASSVALLGEVLPSLRNDAPTIVVLALLGLLVATGVVGRSLPRTLATLSPLLVAAGITLGVMALTDLRVNFYNLMIFPLAFGIGVDGAIYVVWSAARKSNPSRGLHNDPVALSARAVLASTLTTIVAFGSMAVATNPGLVTLAELAALALGATLLANLVWLPAMLRSLESTG